MERLTPADLAMLWPEDSGWSQDIGVIGVLDGTKLSDGDGRFCIDMVRDHIERRLDRLPRFRQLLLRPSVPFGRPLWIDASSIDLAYHIQVESLPAPADQAQLLRVVERCRRQPFDQTRPLWRMWFFEGLAGRRIGFYIRLHHAVGDGVAGVAALAALVDTDPDAGGPIEEMQAWSPRPQPSNAALLWDNLRWRLRAFGRAFGRLMRPVSLVRSSLVAWRVAFRVMVGEGKAPRSSINRRIGSARRLATIPSDLQLQKAVAHSWNAKVNDVLLATIADGLIELLRSRAEPLVPLRAMVPVSLQDGRGDVTGNHDAGMLIRLPLGEPDRTLRLTRIASETMLRKRQPLPSTEAGLFKSTWFQRLGMRLIHRQRLGNLYVANVPGPPMVLYLAGAQILELFPVIPLMGNISIGVGAISYAGQFNLTVVADSDICPDLSVFVEALERSLSTLPTLALRDERLGATRS